MKKQRRVNYIRGVIYVVANNRHEIHRLYFRGGLKPEDVERIYVPSEILNLPGATIMVTKEAQNFPNIGDFYQNAVDMDCHIVRL